MGKMEPEHEAVMKVLESRCIPDTLFTKKVIDRRRLKLTKDSLVVGEHPIINTALKILNIDAPLTDCYPTSIRHFLKRKVWTSTVGIVKSSMNMGQLTAPVFVKPLSDSKKFTGFIYDSPTVDHLFGGTSNHTQVYFSELVN